MQWPGTPLVQAVPPNESLAPGREGIAFPCNQVAKSIILTTTCGEGVQYSGWICVTQVVARYSLVQEFPIVVKGALLTKNLHRKWWLAAVAVLCLTPAASAKPRTAVPEGGSAAVYLLGTAITCLGAMVVRSRFARPKQL
jgi:hypothetical protein